MTAEEQRALEYRQQCARRARSRAQQHAQLAGDPAAAARIRASAAPLLSDPLDTWDCPDPPEPTRPDWVGSLPAGIELPNYLTR